MKTETVSIEISWDELTGDSESQFSIPGRVPVTALLLSIEKLSKIIVHLSAKKVGLELFDDEEIFPIEELEELTFADIAPADS